MYVLLKREPAPELRAPAIIDVTTNMTANAKREISYCLFHYRYGNQRKSRAYITVSNTHLPPVPDSTLHFNSFARGFDTRDHGKVPLKIILTSVGLPPPDKESFA
jgi:hypothetical protein